MSRKPIIRPLFPVKGEFYASLDRLLQAVEFAVRINNIPDVLRDQLKERAAAFRAALSQDEDDPES